MTNLIDRWLSSMSWLVFKELKVGAKNLGLLFFGAIMMIITNTRQLILVEVIQ